ncbi:MAG: DbpA RNA binding domain-containing protein [Labilithrix sp.]|nr:DbpA RNA binding domain-containing protein [Labilithrix sp.]
MSADADTVDGRPPLPQYHIEDEPTVVFGGRLPKPRAAQVSREQAPESGSVSSREPRHEGHTDDPAFTNVFLNVGRRDGLHAEDVQRLLVEKAGLAEGDIGHVRLRDRITFVGIRKEHSERAIKALVGHVVGDRTLNAEPARER